MRLTFDPIPQAKGRVPPEKNATATTLRLLKRDLA
jgi:hypothetical protein